MALSDGVVGQKLIAYFTMNHGSLPIKAEPLAHVSEEQMQYRINFANGDVSDWLITFEPNDPDVASEDIRHDIVSAECFNEVI